MTEKCLCRNKELIHACGVVSNMVVGVPTAMTVGSSLSQRGSYKPPEMGAPLQVIDGRKDLRRGGGQEADQGWGRVLGQHVVHGPGRDQLQPDATHSSGECMAPGS